MEWVAGRARTELYTTSVNIAEIRYGITIQPDATRRESLQHWLDHSVRPLFDDRVLGVAEDTLLQWRIFAHRADRDKQPAPAADLLIAAIAAMNNLPVATRDVAPFVRTGVPVFNPWTAERFNGA